MVDLSGLRSRRSPRHPSHQRRQANVQARLGRQHHYLQHNEEATDEQASNHHLALSPRCTQLVTKSPPADTMLSRSVLREVISQRTPPKYLILVGSSVTRLRATRPQRTASQQSVVSGANGAAGGSRAQRVEDHMLENN